MVKYAYLSERRAYLPYMNEPYTAKLWRIAVALL